MRSPIHSEKHYVQTSQTSVAAAATGSVAIVNAVHVENKSATTTSEIIEGSIVKAVYLEYWLLGAEASNASSSFIFTVYKVQSADVGMTFSQMNGLAGYTNKKNVLFTSQGLLGGDLTNPTPVIRTWIKIPKSKQRFGLADRLFVTVAGLAGAIIFCGFATYKEYS